jgi:hypothetical protein
MIKLLYLKSCIFIKLDNGSFEPKHASYRDTQSSGMFVEVSGELVVPSLMVFLDFLIREYATDRLPRKVSNNTIQSCVTTQKSDLIYTAAEA